MARPKIVCAVGDWSKGAKNRHDDVERVQILLTAAAAKLRSKTIDPNGIDGKIATNASKSGTVLAIHAFQREHCGFSRSDGHITPEGPTFAKLLGFHDAKQDLDPPTQIGGQTLAKEAKLGKGVGFPLAILPTLSYESGGRKFGAARKSDGSNGAKAYRKHAGCDLIVPEGTPVYATADGKVTRGHAHFYRGTYSMEIDHQNFKARYCEIQKTKAPGIELGAEVKKGQLIGYVGKMYHDSMLHLELYGNTLTGKLTVPSQPLTTTFGSATPYQRRLDLMNPTPILNKAKQSMPSS